MACKTIFLVCLNLSRKSPNKRTRLLTIALMVVTGMSPKGSVRASKLVARREPEAAKLRH